jgi:uncharacterized protein YjbJ (UPF0337 family)
VRTLKLRLLNNGKEHSMNWDRIEGQWAQLKGRAREQWGKLSDDDVDVVAGKRDQLAGKIQERYGIKKEEAVQQVATWLRRAEESWFSKGTKKS